MVDIALIGGGLCGLALAHSLQARGADWRLFEARDRLGGRVLTEHAADGTPVDLGATWFWPGTQPAITRLVADLGLTSFAQHDDGRVLHLPDPNRAPQSVALTEQLQPAADTAWPATPGAVHGGARRVAGGMGTVIDTLARPLPKERVRPGHQLEALVDHGDFIELRLRHGEASYSVNARRVVLALPPRVAHAQIRFSPELPPELVDALQATPTWMAGPPLNQASSFERSIRILLPTRDTRPGGPCRETHFLKEAGVVSAMAAADLMLRKAASGAIDVLALERASGGELS